MSKGRPDYNIKVVPIAEQVGDDEEPLHYHKQKALNAYDVVELINENTPTNYDYYITTLIVYALSPGFFHGYFFFNTTESVYFSFEGTYEHSFKGGAMLYMPGNSLMYAVLNSYVDQNTTVGITLRGYKIEI